MIDIRVYLRPLRALSHLRPLVIRLFFLLLCFEFLFGANLRGRGIEEDSHLEPEPPKKKEAVDFSQSSENIEDKVSSSPSSELSPEVISNHYLVLTGQQSRRHSVSFFLAIKHRGEVSEIRGVLIQERESIGIEIVGNLEGEKGERIILHEVISQGDEVVPKNSWTLSKAGEGRWKASSSQSRINLQEITPATKKEFRFQGEDIHPQVIDLLFEKVNGSYLSINVRNYRSRSLTRQGEWRHANLEYGYIRYRVLANSKFSWILETERSGGGNSDVDREIIHVVWIKDYLSLFQIIDQDDPPHSLLIADEDVSEMVSIDYRKKVTGLGFADYLSDIAPDLTLPREGMGETEEWCDTCSYAILSLSYNVDKDLRTVESLELIPGEDPSAEENNPNHPVNNPIEKGFQETVKHYLDRGISYFKDNEITSLIQTWLKRTM